MTTEGTMLHSNLFEVQQQALAKGHNLPGFAYFMQMGLGKTRVLLYDAFWHMQSRRIDVAIVLCPRSLRGTWRQEAEDIGFPYPVLLYDGTAASMWKRITDCKGPCMVVIHYDIVLTKGGDLIELLKEKGKRLMLGLDESTRIKNPNAKVGKYLVQIKDFFKYIRLLSGSPAPQGVHDLWQQFTLIGLTTTPYYGFRNTYCRMGGFKGKKIVGVQNLDILRQRTDHGVFRAKKCDWTDLPEKIYPHPREIEMTKKQREAYLTMMHDFVLEWGDKEITALMAVTAKAKLSQIGTGFIYDNEGGTTWLFEEGEKNPKVEELLEVIDQTNGKLLVFYNHRPAAQLLTEALDRAGIKHADLVSKLNDDQVTEQKRLFNEVDEYKVAIMQGSSYKYGHTMLGTENEPCYTSVFFENNYDMEARVQCEDRNHRHGQKYPVTYIDLSISKEDEKVILALQKKAGMQEAILQEFGSKPSWN